MRTTSAITLIEVAIQTLKGKSLTRREKAKKDLIGAIIGFIIIITQNSRPNLRRMG